MEFYQIVTLTVNPALDKSTHFSNLVAEQKIRCDAPHYDAGGGGINASKAIARLGGKSLAIFTSGGSAGKMLESLVDNEGIAKLVVLVENWTRESLVAVDSSNNKQYRFGFPGQVLSEAEIAQIIEMISTIKTNYLVASGSLNEGLPPNFYAKIGRICKDSGIKFILDTSGEPLKKALEAGVFLVKPNIGELANLIGVKRLETHEVADAAKKLIASGSAQIVVISLGPDGAILVTHEQTHHVAAPHVTKKSTVGAGDSMVGGMVWALTQGKTMKEVVQWGVACGSAATMNEGTQLFAKEDALKLFESIPKNK